jgi:hypothetical protein
MSLESPVIKIQDWNNFTNRLAAIESALGMTNAATYANGILEGTSGLFRFNGSSVSSSDVCVIVKSTAIETFDGSKDFKMDFQDKIKFNELEGSWEIYPVLSGVRAFGEDKLYPRDALRAIIVGGPTDRAYYTQEDQVTIRVFAQKFGDAGNINPGGKINVQVNLVAFCRRKNSNI